MAIVFTNNIPTDRWLLSENNRIVEFSSDSILNALYCDITITGLPSIRIYPLPDNSFWFNFKNYISTLLRDYADDLELTVDPLNIDSYIKDWTKIYYTDVIEFDIALADDSTDSASVTPYIILGAEQPYDYKIGRTIGDNIDLILSPLKLNTSNRYYMKYWDGYPFDIGYTLELGDTSAVQEIANITNGITALDIDINQSVSRIVFSDGDTTQSLELFLPLVNGYNELKFANLFLDLYKEPAGCGVYLKWLNQYGSYNYWLFNEFYKVDARVKSLGSINNDFYNLEDTISQSKQLGKDSANRWTVFSDDLKPNDMNIAKGILTSPKVYLFTGIRFAQNNFNDWLEVDVITKSATIKEPREEKGELKLNIELPNDYNIKL